MLKKLSFLKKPMLLLLVSFAIYMAFGLNHLTNFITADEHYWIYSNSTAADFWTLNNGRIQQYWDAIGHRDWANTRINDKPGITLAYVSAPGAALKTLLYNKIATGKIAPLSKLDEVQKVLFYYRFPILLFNGLFCFLLFFLIKKLTDSGWIALISASFMLLSPVIVGISQIVNPDSLLWEFTFASLLCFLIYLKEGRIKYAHLAGILAGLSLLTKYTSVILFPFFFAVMLAYFVENIPSWQVEQVSKKIIRDIRAYFLIFLEALAVYAIMLPDNLINFQHFLKGSIGFNGSKSFFAALVVLSLVILADAYFSKSKELIWAAKKSYNLEKYFKMAVLVILPLVFAVVLVNTLFGTDMLNLFALPFDAPVKHFFASSRLDIVLRQFLPLAFSLSPLVLVALFYAWIKNIKNTSHNQWLIFVFSFFILVFVAAVIQQKVPLSIRYSIMLYPLVFTMAAIGISQFFSLEKSRVFLPPFIFFSLVIISCLSLWQAKPFYFNYTNVLLPKQYLIADAWGYAGYEAAQYLNSLPGAKNMRIWSDYDGVCLFFVGNCNANVLTMKNIQKKSATLPKFDYFISSRRGSDQGSSLWDSLQDKYNSQVVWNVQIGGRSANFVRVYANK